MGATNVSGDFNPLTGCDTASDDGEHFLILTTGLQINPLCTITYLIKMGTKSGVFNGAIDLLLNAERDDNDVFHIRQDAWYDTVIFMMWFLSV